jgi:uncharacterized protein YegP (UPF0339 family)
MKAGITASDARLLISRKIARRALVKFYGPILTRTKTMKFEIYKSSSGWRWRLRASNGKVIASGEGYKRRRGAERAVQLINYARPAEVVFL